MFRRKTLVALSAAVMALPLVAADDPDVVTHTAAATDLCGPEAADGADGPYDTHGRWPETDLCRVGIEQRVDETGRLVGLDLFMEVAGDLVLGDGYGRHEFRVLAAYYAPPVVSSATREEDFEGCTLNVLVRGPVDEATVLHNGTCDGGGLVSWFENVEAVSATVDVEGGRLTVRYDADDLDVAWRDALEQVAGTENGQLEVIGRVGRVQSGTADPVAEQVDMETVIVPTDRHDQPAVMGLLGSVPPQRCTDHGRYETAGTPLEDHLCQGDLTPTVDSEGALDGLVLRWELRTDPADAVDFEARIETADEECEVWVRVTRLPDGEWFVGADGTPGDGCAGEVMPGWAYSQGVSPVPGAVVEEDATGVAVTLPASTGNPALAGLVQPGRLLSGGMVFVDGLLSTSAGLRDLQLPR